MLRAIMEDPQSTNPDAQFIAMMREFVSTYGGKNASTEDFRRIVEKQAGEPMDWFFDEWVYGTEVPHYDFSYQLKDAGDGKTNLEFRITQSGVSESFVMRVPIYAYVKGSPRRLGFLGVQGSKPVTGSVPLPFRPEKVALDPNLSILCTIRQ
jgi:aminopeptidase N